MGGNARATNKITGQETLAQKIPIKEIGRQNFIKKFVEMFEEIDKRFEAKYNRPLWKNKKILKNGLAFNGSTSFIMNPEINDDEVIPFKPTSGDLDIMVKESDKADLWSLLDELESKPNFMKDVEYKGSNKLSVSAIGDQINSVFEVTFGDIVTQSQVDFEFTQFEDDANGEEVPMEFSRFGHSSALSDAQNGFKGVSHKYILRALAGGASKRDDVLILTKAGSYEKPKFTKKKGEPITTLNMQKFFISKGMRVAYEKQYIPGTNEPWIEDGKQVYKEIPTENSSYETSIQEMFKILFNSEESKDLKEMWSFVGIVKLMNKYLDKGSIIRTFERFIDLQWGQAAQKLERDHKEIDYEIKINAVNYMVKQIPMLKKYESKIKEMTDTFYANYDKKKISEACTFTGNAFKDYLINEVSKSNTNNTNNTKKLSESKFQVGDKIRIKPEWQDSEDDGDFIIKEINGNKLIVQSLLPEIQKMKIVPTEVVRTNMVIKI